MSYHPRPQWQNANLRAISDIKPPRISRGLQFINSKWTLSTSMKKKSSPHDRAANGPRQTFRHGDLRRALLEAGIDLARSGGPKAVVLREVTRRAGVVPNAAYNHFAGQKELLQAVRSAALSLLALSIENELAAVRIVRDKGAYGRRSLRAVGVAYMRFARFETGLFRTAFSLPAPVFESLGPADSGASGLNPFQLLGLALDRMVEGGVLSPDQRPGAEFLAWATVHGLSLLILDGPLQGIGEEAAEHFGNRILDMVEKGLT
jgi:AcrR family transcriptional regulator